MNTWTRTLLTALAGYCDTVTFVHMKGVFSAHVTGNFVLFAAALVRGLRPEDYLKLLTFPVFVVAVAAATVVMIVLRRRTGAVDARWILVAMGLIFAAGAGLATDPRYAAAITLMVVFALGLQNGLHPFIPGPMTTVMTGTVTNSVAGLTRRLMGEPAPAAAAGGANPLVLIVVFAAGCLIAAWAVMSFGYLSLALPAITALGLAVVEWRITREGHHA